MENINPADGEQLQVEFFSKEKQPVYELPSFPFSIPSSAAKEQLNLVLNSFFDTKKGAGDAEKSASFDFLIDGALVNTTLKEFLTTSDKGKESVLKLECILSEPPPEPDLNLPHEDWVGCVFAMPHAIVSGTYNNSVCVWPRKGAQPSAVTATIHEGPVKCICLLNGSSSANGDFQFVSGSQDQNLLLWNFEEASTSLRVKYALKGHERSVECVCSNSDGTRLASGGFDSYLKIWNPTADPSEAAADAAETTDGKEKKRKTGKTPFITPMVTLAGHKEAVTGVCWTKDAKEVATASWDHSIILWDLVLAGQKTSMSGTKAFTSISCSASSDMIITGSVDKHIRLWDLRSKDGSMVKQTFTSHDGWVTAVNWHPTKPHLFVSSSYDKLVKLWDTRSPAAPLYDLSGHEDRVLACNWSDPGYIVSGGVDSAVKCFKTNP